MSQKTMTSIEILQPSESTDLTLTQEVETHPVAAYLAGLGEGSRAGQFSALACALAIVRGDRLGDLPRDQADAYRAEVWTTEWARLRHEHVAALRSKLQSEYKPASANKVLAAVKGVLKSAWRLDLLSQDQYARAIDVNPVKGQTLVAGRYIGDREVLDLLRSCESDRTAAGTRDGVLLTFGLGVGCRVAEVAGLKVSDYNPETGQVVIRGKGNKTRNVWADNEIADALGDWLEIRGDSPDALFCPITRVGKIEIKPLSTFAVQKIIRKRAEQAGVAPFTWHDLRRTHITNALDLGIDLVIVSKNVGHASLETTAAYDRRPDRARRQAMTKLRVPYKARANGRGPNK